jgi:hypothetical protein
MVGRVGQLLHIRKCEERDVVGRYLDGRHGQPGRRWIDDLIRSSGVPHLW